MPPTKKNKHGLSEKEERFCQEYVVSLDYAEAYVKAGYKSKDHNIARVCGFKMLSRPNVNLRIQGLKKDFDEKLMSDGLRVTQELERHAFADIGEIVELSGNAVLIKDFSKLTPEVRRLISSVKQTKDGVEVKLTEKLRALLRLDERFNPVTKNLNINGSVEVNDLTKLTPEEVRAKIIRLEKELGIKK